MPRTKGGVVSRRRRNKVLKLAKGYFGSKHALYKTAHEQVMHSLKYAYRDRRVNKRNFRKLWITRINAACRQNDISYSKFINGLSKAGIEINRKMLSELAIDNAAAFTELVKVANDALNGKEIKKAVVKETPKNSKIKSGYKNRFLFLLAELSFTSSFRLLFTLYRGLFIVLSLTNFLNYTVFSSLSFKAA